MDTKVFTGVFTAKYRGTCTLPTCERGQEIQQGDACQHVNAEIYHMACARRVHRGETDPLCRDCYRYHVGECA